MDYSLDLYTYRVSCTVSGAARVDSGTSFCVCGWSPSLYPTDPPRRAVVSSMSYPVSAAPLFRTKMGKTLCADPESRWTKLAMCMVDRRKNSNAKRICKGLPIPSTTPPSNPLTTSSEPSTPPTPVPATSKKTVDPAANGREENKTEAATIVPSPSSNQLSIEKPWVEEGDEESARVEEEETLYSHKYTRFCITSVPDKGIVEYYTQVKDVSVGTCLSKCNVLVYLTHKCNVLVYYWHVMPCHRKRGIMSFLLLRRNSSRDNQDQEFLRYSLRGTAAQDAAQTACGVCVCLAADDRRVSGFITIKGKTICSDPESRWAKFAMCMVDKRKNASRAEQVCKGLPVPSTSPVPVLSVGTVGTEITEKKTDPAQQVPQTTIEPAQQAQQTTIKPAQQVPQTTIEPAQQVPQTTTEPAQQAPQTTTEPAQQVPQTTIEPAQQAPQTTIEPAQQAPQTTIEPAQQAQQTTIEPAQQAQQTTIEPAQQVPQTTIEPAQQAPWTQTTDNGLPWTLRRLIKRKKGGMRKEQMRNE
ncbi:hypothetical protein NFI96_004020 [Prochilodus magdalenae]|nr:hypothetical protein NFI96_004020 [Prochilodus magdalenae]